MGGRPHEEADVEGGLPHGAPVLHVPAVLGVQLGVSLGGLALYQTFQQLAPLKLEVKSTFAESLIKNRIEWKEKVKVHTRLKK